MSAEGTVGFGISIVLPLEGVPCLQDRKCSLITLLSSSLFFFFFFFLPASIRVLVSLASTFFEFAPGAIGGKFSSFANLASYSSYLGTFNERLLVVDLFETSRSFFRFFFVIRFTKCLMWPPNGLVSQELVCKHYTGPATFYADC